MTPPRSSRRSTRPPAVVIGRSYGGEVGLDLTLRYPDHVRALVLLEAALLHLSPEARTWEEHVHGRVEAAASRGIDTVGETFITEVLGDGAWERFPDRLRRMFTDNGPAILAEFAGGPLEVDLERLAIIDRPVLLVAASGSPEPFRQVTVRMAAAIPNAEKVTIGGGHFVDPADPSVLGFVRRVIG